MRLPKTVDLATRLTRSGKLTEALAALTAEVPALRDIKPLSGWPERTRLLPVDGGSLKSALDAGLGALGRLGTPAGLKQGGAASPAVPEGARFLERSFAGASGQLTYKLYVPSRGGTAPLPLVVMLHGCTQSPDDFAAGTRMNQWAEQEGFLVAYPAQSRTANAQKCWNWFRTVDQGRSGEPALIVGMVNEIARDEAVDPTRIYVAGLSAGGAAAAVLGQNYPEIFAAVGVHSGLACGAAADMASAFAAMRSGAIGVPTGAGVPTIVFHGDHDSTVAPINGAQVLAQAEGKAPLTAQVENGRSPGGVGYTRTLQTDADGRPVSEHWVLHGAGHAWAGGDPAGSYTDPRGPDATAAMLRFFNHHKVGSRR